jgi:16S rRNA (guanine(527)-N(7))-methyltransferase RsmG
MAAIVPTPEQRSLLERHLDELGVWNQRLNLSTVPRERAWEKHVDESLALLAAASPAAGWRVADIGSGGGIPGVVVAVMRPDLAVTLVESDQRKAGFLVHMAGLLALDNVTIAPRRAEELGRDDEQRGRYDVVVSRAAAAPGRLVELAMPLLRDGASLWALVTDAAVVAHDVAGPGHRATAPASGILRVERLAVGSIEAAPEAWR